MRATTLVPPGLTLLPAALAAYALGLPLTRPRSGRGDYLFGHYALHEIYIGIPAALIAGASLLVWLWPRARRRAFGLRLGAVLLATLGGLFAFDIGFALFVRGAWQPDPWLDFGHISRADNEPDPDLGFRRRPHTAWRGWVPEVGREVGYRVDARGFRNPDGIESAEVAFVGDSYTEAAQVEAEETFVQRFAARTGRSVANLGRGAYGPQQERLVLERVALGLRPRLVVWQLFDGNDLGDAEQFAAWRRGELGTVPLPRRYLDNSFFRPLLESTRRPKRGDFARLLGDDGGELPITVRYRWMPEQTVERAEGFAATAAALRAGAAACRAQRVELVVVLVPVMARVLRARLRFVEPADRERFAPADPEPLRDFGTGLAALCAELDVPFLDLYPAFRAAAAERAEGLFIPRDEHLDVRGHEVVADALARFLDAGR
jgi:lysophospholipase L1-like esterase